MSKINGLLIIGLCLGVLSASLPAHEAHCEDTNLGAVMARMKKNLKQLKRAARNEDFDQVLELARTLQEQTRTASAETPLKYRDQNQAFVRLKEDYQTRYDKLDSQLSQLIHSATAGNTEAVDTTLAQINRTRKDAHKEYRLDCD